MKFYAKGKAANGKRGPVLHRKGHGPLLILVEKAFHVRWLNLKPQGLK